MTFPPRPAVSADHIVSLLEQRASDGTLYLVALGDLVRRVQALERVVNQLTPIGGIVPFEEWEYEDEDGFRRGTKKHKPRKAKKTAGETATTPEVTP